MPAPVARISAAAATTCALRTDGTVACWGGAYAASPQEIAGIGDAVELEVGADLACVLRGRGGGVACWSLAGKGGPGSLAEVPGLDDAVSLSVGATHACSLLRGGDAACWGSNFDGQLGDGTEHDAPTPVRVAGLAHALEITAGDFATCARLEDGSVRCWGRSYAGQLGDALFTHAACADESCSVSPVAVAGLDDALEIAAGLNGACARRSDGHVVAWGWNHAGELGDGALVDRAAPAEVLGLDDAIRVYAGYVRKCALRASGELACWGALPGTGVSEPVLAATNVEVELAERLHADHYVAVGEPWAAELERSGRTAPLDAIARELENLLAVVERVLARRDGKRASADVALRALLVIDPVLTTRGPFGAHLELLDRALAAGERAGSSPALLARALGARGRARHVRGLVEAGLSDLDRAYALAHTIGDLRAESSFLADLGILHRQEHGRALELYERALALSREASDLRGEARALGNLGTLHHDLKDFPQAIRHYQRALALAAEVGDLRLDGIVNMNLAILEQERGAAAGARTRYERAIRCLVEVGDLRLLAIALGNLGLLHHEEGRLEEARASGERAARLLRQVGDRRSEAISLGRLGAALASLERADEAMAALERGERLLEGLGDRLALEGVRLGHAFADSAAARRALVEKREGEALAHLEAARLKMAALTAPGPAGSPSQADRSDDIRASLRILERSLAAMGGAADAQSSDALLLAPEARWFCPPKGAWVDLRTRHQARRVVAKLVEQHRAEPGRGLPLAALLAAGWPGERVLESAGANRLYVLLNQLRKLGLREHLTRTEEGYLLEPRLKIHYVSVEPA